MQFSHLLFEAFQQTVILLCTAPAHFLFTDIFTFILLVLKTKYTFIELISYAHHENKSQKRTSNHINTTMNECTYIAVTYIWKSAIDLWCLTLYYEHEIGCQYVKMPQSIMDLIRDLTHPPNPWHWGWFLKVVSVRFVIPKVVLLCPHWRWELALLCCYLSHVKI